MRDDVAQLIATRLRGRNEVSRRFFAREADRLAAACHQMSERFQRGGRLLAFGRGPYATDAQHVAVEFVHPVIVGKRALPALDLSLAFKEWLPALVRPDDMVMAFGPPGGDPETLAALETAGRRGAMTFALPSTPGGWAASYAVEAASDHPFVHQELIEVLYHTLWETVHVYLEHAPSAAPDDAGAASFLYPFLGSGVADAGRLRAEVATSIRAKAADDERLREQVAVEEAGAMASAVLALERRIAAGGALLLFGNGGSATDANDWALDCVLATAGGPAIPAVSLAMEPANLSAIANDIGTEAIFLRQLIAQSRPQDVAIAISTSGGSRNVVAALEEARKRGLLTFALLGYDGGEVVRRGLAEHAVVVRCDYIPRIQEIQASIYHVMLEALAAAQGQVGIESDVGEQLACVGGGLPPPIPRAETSSAPTPERKATAEPSCSVARPVRSPASCGSTWSGKAATSSSTTSRPSRPLSSACSVSRHLPPGCRSSWSTDAWRRSAGRAAPAWSAPEAPATWHRRRAHMAEPGSPSGPATGSHCATRVRVRGTVQGVGFRPFVYRLARHHLLHGWVRNSASGVEIHVEGERAGVAAFLRDLERSPPPAAEITSLVVEESSAIGLTTFDIESSGEGRHPTTRISPDLPVCDACLAEMRDPADRRAGYPYVNCTDCGPRYTIVLGLPYDRPATTMRDFAMCRACAREYEDPLDRRFHAQPTACPECGPTYALLEGGCEVARRGAAIAAAVELLRAGKVLAVKGIGGYHLAADARHGGAVVALRERKGRREKPFALMVPTVEAARSLIELDATGVALLTSIARPIVLAEARVVLEGVAPDNLDLGVMLPYTPLQELLFDAGAPDILLMTSANRSNEPIAYRDDDALRQLDGLADAFLVGERPIARRVDDSIACVGPLGPTILRRSRGLAPGAVARLPTSTPFLGVGADLKNTVTLVVSGDAFMSQHIGDLEQYEAMTAHRETIDDLVAMYAVDWNDLVVAHDLHPEYASTTHALGLSAWRHVPVQHHRAHVASVLAERDALEQRVLGVALDGTGYGDDGSIWGGEIFAGSVAAGLERVAHLRPAALPGGDAAARYPVQAAAGFLAELDPQGLDAPPFSFPARYFDARKLASSGTRTFRTTSTGRLFDTAAAVLGFRREVTFEGQAAIWLEHLARRGVTTVDVAPMPFVAGELDFRPALDALIEGRRRGLEVCDLAHAFHRALAHGLAEALAALARDHDTRTVVLSGGVFQNRLLTSLLIEKILPLDLVPWTHVKTPPNDGGVSLGQTALALASG